MIKLETLSIYNYGGKDEFRREIFVGKNLKEALRNLLDNFGLDSDVLDYFEDDEDIEWDELLLDSNCFINEWCELIYIKNLNTNKYILDNCD